MPKIHSTIFEKEIIVPAQVEQIMLKSAKCSIICVEDTVLTNEFNSTLRKEDIREKERDKVNYTQFQKHRSARGGLTGGGQSQMG